MVEGRKKRGLSHVPVGQPDEVGSHITRRFMVVKRPYYEHRNSPVRSKKKEGCQEEKAALPIILRQNSRFEVGMKRPNHKRTYRQFVPKKRAGLLYGSSPQRQAMYHQS